MCVGVIADHKAAGGVTVAEDPASQMFAVWHDPMLPTPSADMVAKLPSLALVCCHSASLYLIECMVSQPLPLPKLKYTCLTPVTDFRHFVGSMAHLRSLLLCCSSCE